jgi:hypothetical protein
MCATFTVQLPFRLLGSTHYTETIELTMVAPRLGTEPVILDIILRRPE